jgi:hypothetical protein
MDSSTAGSPSGEYLCYIYGQVPSSNKFSSWVEISPSYKNPGECIGNKGAKVTINGAGSIWQGNSALRRIEFIANFPNSDETGTVIYKWSMMQPGTMTMNTYEHQLVFFENHSCDLKYGNGANNLYFSIQGRSVWSTPFTANTWFNFALQVDYSAKTCTIYHSTGSNPVAQVVAATSSPGIGPSDFHVGILRVSSDSTTTNQSIIYSGVYAERTLTNNLGSACGTPSPPPATSAGVTPTPTSAGVTPTPNPTSAGSPNTPPVGPGGKATVVIITYGDAASVLPLTIVLAVLLAILL